MALKQHFELLAQYNQWMNSRLYEAVARLPFEDIGRDLGAYFGSILGSLNHIVVGDTIWLKRFAEHPACRISLAAVAELPRPESLDQLLFDDFTVLTEHRKWLDEQIRRWIDQLSDSDMDYQLHYRNTKGVAAQKRFSTLVLHFFNHQTHHRGQVTTLLSQVGEDVGVTDLLALIPET